MDNLNNQNIENSISELSLEKLLKEIGKGMIGLSSSELDRVIRNLQKAKNAVEEREAIKRKERERAEAERLKREEEEKREAHIREVTSMDLPLDWENVFDSDERSAGVHADSIQDGLVLSLSNLGKVDIEYISSITGENYKTVIKTLRGSIYQNPETWNECFYKGWETSDEYLSGNLTRKWKAAKESNEKYNGYFSDNIAAIEKVVPPSVATKDIYITLGSPWVPADIIDDFIKHLFGEIPGLNSAFCTRHNEMTGSWEIPYKTRYNHSIADINTYGTRRLEALHILERTLNMKTISVFDKVQSLTNASGEKNVINKEETLLAIEKQQKMIREFQDWVWRNETRKKRLETIFEEKYSCVRRRIFDGSFLDFPTMSHDIKLYPYQKNAVARMLFSRNTLLAHDVGSGKTYEMIAAGMELRRMKLSNKNLFVVPNNIVGQWSDIFLKMYPSAKILVIDPKHFVPAKRTKMLEKIRDDDYDGIIMAYSCFEQIPLSNDFYVNQLRDSFNEINEEMKDLVKITRNLERLRDKISKQITEIGATAAKLSSKVFFEELGITRLFVDEAHNYKNVPVDTKADKVLGIGSGGSKKCKDMMDKVRMIQKSGGGVIMATGTPITNSITDAFIIQKYLQSGELGLLDLQHFDSWIGMFAEKVTEFEIDVDTSGYRLATRFSKFHNLPELTSLLSQVADFHQLDKTNGIPEFEGYTDALIAKTSDFEYFLKDISARADVVRKGGISRCLDNMLKITTDGRKAALDLRLVLPAAGFTYQSKLARCAENVFGIYQKTDGTQLVFCDTSTPKAGLNMYDEMRRLLTGMGIPNDEIAYIHDATTEKKKSHMFDMMRRGSIRVIIGSTFKLGLGVNVQNKLIALHHLDIPWRPADMTQREGRILRQGNTNQKVYIYRYITEGSFDAYSWQLLETKQRFITALLSGTYSERDGTDIEDTVLNYAEVKALAVGNPLVKKRVETANELSRYLALQHKAVENRISLEKELLELPAQILHQKGVIAKAENDKLSHDKYIGTQPRPVTTKEKKDEGEMRKELRRKIYEAVRDNELKSEEMEMISYEGFKIILPANMKKEKPFIWLKRSGKYYVELGDSDVGTLVRIDNFIANLEVYIEKLRKSLTELTDREKSIRNELDRKISYSEKIDNLKNQLDNIDKELGVNRK